MANDSVRLQIFFPLFFFFFITAVQGKKNSDGGSHYDSSATTECLAEPWKPLYNGGILKNPDFEDGVSGWSLFGHGVIQQRISSNNPHNRYIVARHRTGPLDSFAQKVMINQASFYTFSGWVQISEGTELVSVVFRNRDGEFIRSGSTIARKGCWSMIKGGIAANYTGSIDLLFETKNPGVEIWADNLSLQPFTKEQWRSHQNHRIAKKRKSRMRFKVTGGNNTQVQGATISISSIRTAFPFGCGLNYHILDNQHYRNWFTARFPVTAFTNAMKWYSNEPVQGHENYTVSDGMVKFAKQHNISIRGHNIFWDDPKYQPQWVPNLSPHDLKIAAHRRIKSVVTRYAGDMIHWDCMNENLHFRFYEDKLGEDASAVFFSLAHRLDPRPVIFMNEYNTIEWSDDEMVLPAKYIQKLKEIQEACDANEGIRIGIGLQGHFGSGQPNLAYMRATIDIFATTGLPIWLTEVSAGNDTNLVRQAEYLEEVLREAYSHPAVEGIIMFAGPAAAGFKETTLVDLNFDNTAAGDVVDKLIDEWRSKNIVEAKTDMYGVLETRLFKGEYEVTVKHPSNTNNTYVSSRIKVDKDEEILLTWK